MSVLNYSASDIPAGLADRAFRGTSMAPERRGAGVLRDYTAHMASVEAEFSAWETETNSDAMAADLERYRQRYLADLTAYLGAESRCVSSFIAGPSNFPTERMAKRNDVVDKRHEELLARSEQILERLRRKYDPEEIARAPIRMGESDALVKLREKLAKKEALQEGFKAANKIIKSTKLTLDEKRAKLAEMGFSEAGIDAALSPDEFGQLGVPGYLLSNNSAEIRRIEKRIEQVEREQARPETTEPVRFEGGVVGEDAEMDRYYIKHDAKPNDETIRQLSTHGFHWSSQLRRWQRQRTPAARLAIRELTGVIL